MSNSLDLTIRASQIRQNMPTEQADQVVLKTAVVEPIERNDDEAAS